MLKKVMKNVIKRNHLCRVASEDICSFFFINKHKFEILTNKHFI